MGGNHVTQMNIVWRHISRLRGAEALSIWEGVTVVPHVDDFDYVDYYHAGAIIGLLTRNHTLVLDSSTFLAEHLTADDESRREIIEQNMVTYAAQWVHRSHRPLEAMCSLTLLAQRVWSTKAQAELVDQMADAYEREAARTFLWSLTTLHRHTRAGQARLREKAAQYRLEADELRATIESSEASTS